MDARFHWPRCRKIGVCPWAPRRAAPAGAANSRTRPDRSSRRRGSAPPLDPGPFLGAPASDLGLVTLGRPPGGPLHAPAQPAQPPPHVPGVVAHPGEPLDDLRDAAKRPQVGVEPERFWPLAQCLVDRLQLRRRQPGAAAGPPRPPSAAWPPWRQRRYQTLAACADTPKVWATSAWLAPWANMWAASRRRCSRPAKSRRQVPTLIGIADLPVRCPCLHTPACRSQIALSTYSAKLFSGSLLGQGGR